MKKSEKIKSLIKESEKNPVAVDKYGLLTSNRLSENDKKLLQQIAQLLKKRGE